MSTVNKVILLGRLTKDVETHTFNNGGKVATIRFVVDAYRRKNQSTGKYESVPCYLDCKAFNGEKRKLADLCEQYLAKGDQAHIIGHLQMEEWEDKNGGGKRQKLVCMIDELTFIPKGEKGERSEPRQTRSASPPPSDPYEDDPPPREISGDDIPF